jgi:hypothetical protein
VADLNPKPGTRNSKQYKAPNSKLQETNLPKGQAGLSAGADKLQI